MTKVLLDTNFIITCVRNKIDFFNEIPVMGLQIIIPKQVISELEAIARSKKKLKTKDGAVLSLSILLKNDFKLIDLHIKGNYVDKGIKKYARENREIIIATLDRDLKKLPNRKLIVRGKKRLEII